MHQARLLTKYAAYKAVRAWALHHANMQKMERAALAVLLPLVSRDSGGGEYLRPTHAASDFQGKWNWAQVLTNKMDEAELPYVQVTLCGPLRGNFPGNPREVNFDAPAAATSDDWEQGQRGPALPHPARGGPPPLLRVHLLRHPVPRAMRALTRHPVPGDAAAHLSAARPANLSGCEPVEKGGVGRGG